MKFVHEARAHREFLKLPHPDHCSVHAVEPAGLGSEPRARRQAADVCDPGPVGRGVEVVELERDPAAGIGESADVFDVRVPDEQELRPIAKRGGQSAWPALGEVAPELAERTAEPIVRVERHAAELALDRLRFAPKPVEVVLDQGRTQPLRARTIRRRQAPREAERAEQERGDAAMERRFGHASRLAHRRVTTVTALQHDGKIAAPPGVDVLARWV